MRKELFIVAISLSLCLLISMIFRANLNATGTILVSTIISNARTHHDATFGNLQPSPSNRSVLLQQVTNPNWIEWASNDSVIGGDQFYEFGGDWTVPAPPPDNNLVFMFNGLEPGDGSKILQPVLWWGVSHAGGGNYWSIAAWWVWADGSYWVSPDRYTHAQTGDIVHGEIWRNPANLDNWIIKIWDKTRRSDLVARLEVTDPTSYTWAYVTLEVPNFRGQPNQGGMLPGTSTFSNLYLSKQGYVKVTPSWSPAQNYVGFGLQVIVHDATSVTLATGTVVGGGIVVPIDKFGLLAPHIGLASTIFVATVATTIYVMRVKRRKEKQ